MKQLVIISGKGGTGKTTISAALISMAKPLVIADCDVDAANLHLIIPGTKVEKHTFIGGKKAFIDAKQCNICGTCLNLCQFDAISQDDCNLAPSIDPIACEGCGVCAHFCPTKCISFNDNIDGEWYVSDSKFGPMIHARLKPGAGNSGKLVTIIKRKAEELARENQALSIIDGPPGLGCPVIASISGSSLALVVIEPTVSGFSDLERILDLTRHFKIKTLVCINKSDINQDVVKKIETSCQKMGVEVIGKIPYDKDVIRALMAGKTICEYNQEAKSTKAIHILWRNLADRLSLH